MAQSNQGRNPSIIEIIDKMVKDGESEEKILVTLKDLGVSPDNAKRLLILGQADVFSLLKGEIRKNLREELSKGVPEVEKVGKDPAAISEGTKSEILKSITNELRQYEGALAEQNKKMREELMRNLADYERNLNLQIKSIQEPVKSSRAPEISEKTKQELLMQNRSFQEQISQKVQKINEIDEKTHKDFLAQTRSLQEQLNDRINKISDLEEKIQKRINSIGDEVKRVESDLGEAGIQNLSTRNKTVSYGVIILGGIFGISTLYFFFTQLQANYTTVNLVTMTVLAIITVTLLVVGTLL